MLDFLIATISHPFVLRAQVLVMIWLAWCTKAWRGQRLGNTSLSKRVSYLRPLISRCLCRYFSVVGVCVGRFGPLVAGMFREGGDGSQEGAQRDDRLLQRPRGFKFGVRPNSRMGMFGPVSLGCKLACSKWICDGLLFHKFGWLNICTFASIPFLNV